MNIDITYTEIERRRERQKKIEQKLTQSRLNWLFCIYSNLSCAVVVGAFISGSFEFYFIVRFGCIAAFLFTVDWKRILSLFMTLALFSLSVCLFFRFSLAPSVFTFLFLSPSLYHSLPITLFLCLISSFFLSQNDSYNLNCKRCFFAWFHLCVCFYYDVWAVFLCIRTP